jgi:hypothetical protein
MSVGIYLKVSTYSGHKKRENIGVAAVIMRTKFVFDNSNSTILIASLTYCSDENVHFGFSSPGRLYSITSAPEYFFGTYASLFHSVDFQ